MKRLLLIAALMAVLSGCQPPSHATEAAATPDNADARTHASQMPAAYHEFQVFGEDRTYFSHYAMFSSIHAYQVILEVEIPEEARAAIRAFRAEQPDMGLSFSPSTPSDQPLPIRHDWVLPEETQPERVITGDLHWVADGDDWADPAMRHFIARNVSARVVGVVHRQMFYPDTPRSVGLAYVVVWHGDDVYLAHILTQDPDFDQIVRVTFQGEAPAQGAAVSVERSNTLEDRLTPGQTVEVRNHQGRVFSVAVDSEVGVEELERQH